MDNHPLVGGAFLELKDFHLLDENLEELLDSLGVLRVDPSFIVQGGFDDAGLVVHEEEGLFRGLINLVTFFFEFRVFLLEFGKVVYEGWQAGGLRSGFSQHVVDVLDLCVDNLLSFTDTSQLGLTFFQHLSTDCGDAVGYVLQVLWSEEMMCDSVSDGFQQRG